MSNEVQFDTDTQSHSQYGSKNSKLVLLVIKYSGGLVKDKTQANYVLLVFSVIAFSITAYLYIGLLGKPKSIPLTAEQMKEMNISAPPVSLK